MVAKFISMSTFKVNIFHANFYTISCNRIRDRTTTRIWGINEIAVPPMCIQMASLLFLIIYVRT